MIAFRSCLISSIHVRCGLPLGRLTFLRYSASASLAGVTSRLNSDLYPTYDVRVFPGSRVSELGE